MGMELVDLARDLAGADAAGGAQARPQQQQQAPGGRPRLPLLNLSRAMRAGDVASPPLEEPPPQDARAAEGSEARRPFNLRDILSPSKKDPKYGWEGPARQAA